jgi:hypothetical protein
MRMMLLRLRSSWGIWQPRRLDMLTKHLYKSHCLSAGSLLSQVPKHSNFFCTHSEAHIIIMFTTLEMCDPKLRVLSSQGT